MSHQCSAEQLQNFFRAIKRQNLVQVSEYVRQGIMLQIHQKQHIAQCLSLAENNWEIMKIILKGNPAIINDDTTSLMRKCVGIPDRLHFLLKAGGDANLVVKSNFHSARPEPILIYALRARAAESVPYLVSGGANVHFRCERDETPLILACQHCKNQNQVHSLLTAGAEVNAVDRKNQTALIHAAKNKVCGTVMKNLMNYGADVNMKDSEGKTALIHAAIGRQSPHVFKVLLSEGKADPNVADNTGQTALLCTLVASAGMKGHREKINMLLESGADPNFPPEAKPSSMGLAIAAQDADILELLVSFGADLNKCKEGLLDKVMKNTNFCDKLKAMKLLFASTKGEPITDCEDLNNSLLSAVQLKKYYTDKQKYSIVELLLANGANVNVTDSAHMTPLMWAAKLFESFDLLILLIEAGSNVSAKDSKKNTALHYIASSLCHFQFPEKSQLLLGLLQSKGADFNAIDSTGQTPLMCFLKQGCEFQVFKRYVEAGTDLSILDADKNSAFHYAAACNATSFPATKHFIENGFNDILCMKNSENVSPFQLLLKYCIKRPDISCLEYILNVASNFEDDAHKSLFSAQRQRVVYECCSCISDVLQKSRVFDIIFNAAMPKTTHPDTLTLNFPVNVYSTMLIHESNFEFNFMAAFLLKLTPSRSSQYGSNDPNNNWVECVKKLVSYGYEVVPEKPSCISPLTVLLNFSNAYDGKPPTEKKQVKMLEVAQYFIEHGASVSESRLLFQEELRTEIQQEYPVPDSLWLAAISGNVACVFLLLPYWPFPPLALLVHILPGQNRRFESRHIFQKYLSSLYPVLAAGGPLPIGSSIYKEVSQLLVTIKSIPTRIKLHFDSMHLSDKVPSLLSLCRVAMRASLPAGTDLPQSLRELVPYYGLEELVQLDLDTTKILAQLNNIVVEEEEMADDENDSEDSDEDIDFVSVDENFYEECLGPDWRRQHDLYDSDDPENKDGW